MKTEKINLTKLFKIGILSFCISLLFSSCENDEFIINSSNQEKNTSYSQKTFGNIQKTEKFKEAFNKVFKTKKQALTSDNRLKTVMEVNYGFTIDTNAVNIISSDKFTSYTMLIHRSVNDETFYENLIIQIDSLNNTKAYILKYKLRSQLTPHEDHHSFEQDTEITVTPIIYDNTQSKIIEECRTIWVTYCPYQFEHVAGPSCYNHPERLYQKPKSECITYDDGPDTIDTGGGGTSGGSTGVGGGSSTSIYTTPIISNISPIKFYEIITSFEDAINFVPSRFESVETQFSYLGAVGKFLKQTEFYELGEVLFDLSINQTTVNQNEAALMASKTVEILNLIKNIDNFDQLSISSQKIVATNSLFLSLLPNVTSIVGQYWPKNDEEWMVINDLIKQFLPELILGFVPGSSALDVISGINKADAITVTLGIAGLLVDAFGGSIFKGFAKASKVVLNAFTSFKIIYKYAKTIRIALKNGLKITLDNNTVKLFNKTGNEIGSVLSNVLRLKFPAYGGDIISHPSKTTTIIGKFAKDQPNGTDALIKSGLTESINGVTSKTTFNVLNEVPNPNWTTDQQIWDNINEPWLRDAASRNDIIRVISDPNNPINLINDKGQISFFAREHNLLTTPVSQGGLGYTYNPLTYTYTK
ncbi:hypothetical protein [Polaribacter gangjinensis]|uniref:Uncharacterized protein n=1 Tax=Polaribacter gangjinensis TaxID=574710 RepID=A0A2S7W976_9FLAO|nr:hypothetical protein [Polaribacter gangjinensis]PQJ74159.1 hypothetical protein BTO13_02215 [Polaribacter gangjinensis]